MKNLSKLATRRFVTILVVLSSLIACSRRSEPLAPLNPESVVETAKTSLDATFCTQEPSAVKSHLKFIFVLDKSGSNQDDLSKGSVGGSDPTGVRRYLPLKLFMEKYTADPTVFFSLVNLSTNASLIQGLTNNSAQFKTVVDREANPNKEDPPKPTDGGWTNFQSTFREVYNIINADITNAKEAPEVVSSAYVVFFISDGAPYVDGNDVSNLQNKTQIIEQVKSIVALGKDSNKMYVDSIQIHTGYYFVSTESETATEYMSEIAVAGGGDFYRFSDGNLIDFSQFTLPLRQVQHVLRDVFLESLNTVWSNGALDWDGDGDGISDREEKRLGSDPTKEDSDDNAVSDGVELYALGKPCKDATCNPALAENFTGCTTFLPQTTAEAVSSIPVVRGRVDPDKDFLNSCEEQLVLKSDTTSFDTNSDWIPDGMAFRSKLAFIYGANEANLDPDADGVTNYNEIKKGTPINFSNKDLMGFNPFKYDLHQVSQAAGKTCYALSIKDISTINNKQKFRLHIVDSTAIIDTKAYLRTAELTLEKGKSNKVTEDQFK